MLPGLSQHFYRKIMLEIRGAGRAALSAIFELCTQLGFDDDRLLAEADFLRNTGF